MSRLALSLEMLRLVIDADGADETLTQSFALLTTAYQRALRAVTQEKQGALAARRFSV
jgi:hypothetical protein